MLRALFFSKNTEDYKFSDNTAKDLLDALDKEILRKKRIIVKALAAFTVGSLGCSLSAAGIYFLNNQRKEKIDYVERQYNPATWDKPCGDVVAQISDDYGQGYSTRGACPKSFFSSEFSYWKLKEKSPACYEWCLNLPREGVVQFGYGLAMFVTAIGSLAVIGASINGICGYGPDKLCVHDLSQAFQHKVKEFLYDRENVQDISVDELKNILNDLNTEHIMTMQMA